MDQLEQLAKDSLGPGLSVLVRPAAVRDGQCIASTPEDCDGLREWMQSKKAAAEGRGVVMDVFVMELVDVNMVVRSTLWEGDV